MLDFFSRIFSHTEYNGGQEVVTDHDGMQISTTVTNNGVIDIVTDKGEKLYSGRDIQQARENVESAVRVHNLYKK